MGIIINDGGSFVRRPRHPSVLPLIEGPAPFLTRTDRLQLWWARRGRGRARWWDTLRDAVLAADEPVALARAYAMAAAVNPDWTASLLVSQHALWTTGTLTAAVAHAPTLLRVVLERMGDDGSGIRVSAPIDDHEARWAARREAAGRVVALLTRQWPTETEAQGAWLHALADAAGAQQAHIQWPTDFTPTHWASLLARHLSTGQVARLLAIPGSPSALATQWQRGFGPRDRWHQVSNEAVQQRVLADPALAAQLRDDVWQYRLLGHPEPGRGGEARVSPDRWGLQQDLPRGLREDLQDLLAADTLGGRALGPLVFADRTAAEWTQLGEALVARSGATRFRAGEQISRLERDAFAWVLRHCPPEHVAVLWRFLSVMEGDLIGIVQTLSDPALVQLGLTRADARQLLRHRDRQVRLFAFRLLPLLAAEASPTPEALTAPPAAGPPPGAAVPRGGVAAGRPAYCSTYGILCAPSVGWPSPARGPEPVLALSRRGAPPLGSGPWSGRPSERPDGRA